MITLYLGKSGAGKDTFKRKYLELFKDTKSIVSYTTRPIRPNEVDGVDYNFISEQKFQSLINKGKIMEYRVYHVVQDGVKLDWYYGTPVLDTTENWVGVVDIQGAETFIKHYGADNIAITYVVVDSDEDRCNRVKARGDFKTDEWERRYKDDEEKFSEDKLKSLVKLFGKPITVLHNNDNVTFSQITL